MNNYTYAICDVVTDLNNIDFNQVITTNINTIRKSNDDSLFMVKFWNNQIPSFITNGTVIPSQTLNQDQCIILFQNPEWIQTIQ